MQMVDDPALPFGSAAGRRHAPAVGLLGLMLRGALVAALSIGTGACVVRDTGPVNPGYGYGLSTQGHASANVTVGQPSPYYVASSPPEPLYEQMSDSPGDGSVWIDGYWHWNGYEWVWLNGRWEREQVGYVYVEPSYAWTDEQAQYVYTPGYWAQPERVPRGWHLRDHRDGRPTRVAPPIPPAAPPGHRPPIAGGHRPPTHGNGGGPVYYPPPRPRPGYGSYPTGGTVYYPPPQTTTQAPSGPQGPVGPSGTDAPATPPPAAPSGAPGGVYMPMPMPVQPRPSPGPSGGSYHPPSRDLPWRAPTRVDNGPPAPPPTPSAPVYVNPSPPAPAPAPAPSAPPPVWRPAPAPASPPGRPVERPAPSRREK